MMLPRQFKIPGIFLIAAGLVLTVVYLTIKIEITVPVFAVVTSYINTSFFKLIETNIIEEIILLCFIIGFIFTAYSKDKDEDEHIKKLRGEAWMGSVFINSVALLLIVIFTYGIAFIVMLLIVSIATFLVFHVLFWMKKKKSGKIREKD